MKLSNNNTLKLINNNNNLPIVSISHITTPNDQLKCSLDILL